MLDPKILRTDIDSVAEQLLRRGFQLDQDYFMNLEKQRKSLQVDTQELIWLADPAPDPEERGDTQQGDLSETLLLQLSTNLQQGLLITQVFAGILLVGIRNIQKGRCQGTSSSAGGVWKLERGNVGNIRRSLFILATGEHMDLAREKERGLVNSVVILLLHRQLRQKQPSAARVLENTSQTKINI